jgi:hypothetical protein
MRTAPSLHVQRLNLCTSLGRAVVTTCPSALCCAPLRALLCYHPPAPQSSWYEVCSRQHLVRESAHLTSAFPPCLAHTRTAPNAAHCGEGLLLTPQLYCRQLLGRRVDLSAARLRQRQPPAVQSHAEDTHRTTAFALTRRKLDCSVKYGTAI